MIQKRGNPISGARLPQRRPFVLGNQAETSRTAQQQVLRDDIPQNDAQLRAPVETNPYYKASADFARDAMRYGGTGKPVSVRNAPTIQYGAVGYDNGPYSNRGGLNPVNDGFPQRGGKGDAGRISTNAGPQVRDRDAIENGRYVRETGSDRRAASRRYKGIFGMGLS